MQKIFRDIKNRKLNLETFKKALDKNPKMIDWVVKAPPKQEAGMSLLQMATRYCCFDIANYLIDKGIDVNYMPPDNGLPMTECWVQPVLPEAVRCLLAGGYDWQYRVKEKHKKDQMDLVIHLLEKGADPNQLDYTQRDTWDYAVETCTNVIPRIEQEYKEQYAEFASKVFALLYQYHADILNLDRIRNRNSVFFGDFYLLIYENLILNRDDLYGVAPDHVSYWRKYLLPVIPVLRPFYMKNNPNYEQA